MRASPPKPSLPPSPGGFTIIELLVAGAVLSLLVLLVAQMVGGATQIAGGGRKRMDADAEARAVFDRMSADFAQMLKRPDVHALFVDRANNDEMYFYSQAPAFSTNANTNALSPIALVGYRVNGTNHQLERHGGGRSWDDLKFVTVGTNGATNTDSLITAPADGFHVVSPSVFRMEYSFLAKQGTNFTKAYSPGMTNVSAVVVTIAVLDETSRKILSEADLDALAGTLADASTEPAATAWATNYLQAGIPAAAKSHVRIYQRYFYLNP